MKSLFAFAVAFIVLSVTLACFSECTATCGFCGATWNPETQFHGVCQGSADSLKNRGKVYNYSDITNGDIVKKRQKDVPSNSPKQVYTLDKQQAHLKACKQQEAAYKEKFPGQDSYPDFGLKAKL